MSTGIFECSSGAEVRVVEALKPDEAALLFFGQHMREGVAHFPHDMVVMVGALTRGFLSKPQGFQIKLTCEEVPQ